MSEKLYCKGGGCSAKLGAKKLSKILGLIDTYHDENLLVGFDQHDDAAIYQINDDQAVVSTLDFFPPMVEDPYIFGQIAATNALSDIYAMGAKPIMALNIVCFDDQMDLNILGKIIEGGNDKLKEAKVALSGGHSIKDASIKYGLSVTGIVDPKKMYPNHTPKQGDVLILTKKLGVGLALNAKRLNDIQEVTYQEVIQSMTTLNKYALAILQNYSIHALSDVTGFGLAVHLSEMLGENYSAILNQNKIPYFDECPRFVEEFYLSGAAQTNRQAIENQVVFAQENFILEEIIYDPQTSGGLLASVAKEDLTSLLEAFKQAKLPCFVIGEITKRQEKAIYIK